MAETSARAKRAERAQALPDRRVISPAAILSAAAYLLVSALVLWIFLSGSGVNRNPHAAFEAMLAGTADRPFVTRALVPLAVNGLAVLVPAGAAENLGQAAWVQDFLTRAGWSQHVDTTALGLESLLAIALLYASLAGFAFALRMLFARLYESPPWVSALLPLAALSCLPVFFNAGYIYDLPVLFLFTLALALLAARRWAAYLLVFGLAALNKETAVLLLGAFVLLFFRDEALERKKFSTLAGAQAVIYAAVWLATRLAFRANPGGLVEFHLADNLAMVSNPAIAGVLTLAAALVAGLAFAGWRDKPRFLKVSLWMAAPLLVLMVFFGLLIEIRVLYEVYPVIFLLSAHTVLAFIGRVTQRPYLTVR